MSDAPAPVELHARRWRNAVACALGAAFMTRSAPG
jgi:hypothetical protein